MDRDSAAPLGQGRRSLALPARWPARLVAVAALALAAVLAVAYLSRRLPVALLDFNHYYTAGQLLWQRLNPYGSIEFFAPPWLALALGPWLLLPLAQASAAWLVLNLGCVAATALVGAAWLGGPRPPLALAAALLAAMLMPAALFAYITGQITPLVGLAVLYAARRAKDAPPWLLAGSLLAATLKPHVAALPAALVLLELARARQWPALRALGVGTAGCAAFAFAVLPSWPVALWQAWTGGAFRGGPGLVAPGYVGLAELGVPVWMFVPLGAYAAWAWWRDGLTPGVTALALAAGLLLLPYTRAYDGVLLYFPLLAAVRAAPAGRRWLAWGLAAAAWLAPLTVLSVLSPALAALALLVGGPAARRALAA